jgi:arginase
MKDSSRFIKLVEIYSDIAGRRKGAGLGIDALIESCEKIGSRYFKKYPAEVILDENTSFKEDTPYSHAKYIDKISLVIERVATRIKALRDENLFPIVLSGDHASCAGTMHGLKMAHPKDEIGVVYIDAHADIHSPYTSHSGNMHGMPLAIVTAEDNCESKINNPVIKEQWYWEKLKKLSGVTPAIKPQNIIFCGLRDYELAEETLINRYGITKYSAKDITYKGVKLIVDEIFKKLSHCKYVYVSFDVDSIDPIYLPGTGTPSEYGLSFDQALQLNMQLLKNEKVCCWEIAEINPIYDENNRGTMAIFNILELVTKMLIKNY